jgi:hypothetical protein
VSLDVPPRVVYPDLSVAPAGSRKRGVVTFLRTVRPLILVG